VDLALDLVDLASAARNLEIVEVLQIEPELGVGVEISRQAEGGFRSNPPAPMHNLTDAGGRNVQVERELVHGEPQGLHEVFAEHLAWVDRGHQRLSLGHPYLSLLVIINDLHAVAMAAAPLEADSPLLIDANRVLSRSTPSQGLQLIPRWRGQNTQFRGRVKLEQFPQSDPFDGPKAPGMTVMKKFLGLLRAEAPDHMQRI
jgi:hypothetical protein